MENYPILTQLLTEIGHLLSTISVVILIITLACLVSSKGFWKAFFNGMIGR